MLRRAKPHPRSLDALFPRPKKPPVRFCPVGHRMGPAQRTCSTCRLIALEEAQAREREAEWMQQRPVGPVLRHLVVSTGRVLTYAIPGWAQEARRRQDQARRRRPRRRSRVSSAP